MKRLFICIIMTLLIFTGCGSDDSNKQPNTSAEDSSNNGSTEEAVPRVIPAKFNPVDVKISSLSNEEIIGQMLVFPLGGTSAPGAATERIIRETHCANFILLANNYVNESQLAEFIAKTNELNQLQNIPYLFCIDEEGGDVTRMDLGIPSARKTAQSSDPEASAYNNGAKIAQSLKQVGIRLCLAPVMDTAKDPKKSSLGTRIFSADPNVVATLGTSFINGLHDNGVASAIKHFPGVGNTKVDSHEKFPVIKGTREEIENFELVSFKAGIENGTDVVMIGHLLMPAFDKESPASLSPTIINGLLREEWGYNGIIMTDDMYMSSITSSYKIEDACLKSVLAGMDMVLALDKEEQIYQKLLAAVNDGTLTRERLEESMRRILIMKLKYSN